MKLTTISLIKDGQKDFSMFWRFVLKEFYLLKVSAYTSPGWREQSLSESSSSSRGMKGQAYKIQETWHPLYVNKRATAFKRLIITLSVIIQFVFKGCRILWKELLLVHTSAWHLTIFNIIYDKQW